MAAGAGADGSHRQTFGRLVLHTPFGTRSLELPWTFSTFDYAELCRLLWEQSDAGFETAKVNGRSGDVVHTDRGDSSARLIVDALGWRRKLGNGYQPPDAPLRAGWRCIRTGSSADGAGSTGATCPSATAGASRRRGAADRRGLVRPALPRQGHHRAAGRGPRADPVRYQGNWIPSPPRAASDDGIFFVGDSAAIACRSQRRDPDSALLRSRGRELRTWSMGRQTTAQALVRYGDFSASHRWKFECMLAAQRAVPRVPPRLLNRAPGRWPGSASSTGPSATTWPSRRRSSPERRGRLLPRGWLRCGRRRRCQLRPLGVCDWGPGGPDGL